MRTGVLLLDRVREAHRREEDDELQRVLDGVAVECSRIPRAAPEPSLAVAEQERLARRGPHRDPDRDGDGEDDQAANDWLRAGRLDPLEDTDERCLDQAYTFLPGSTRLCVDPLAGISQRVVARPAKDPSADNGRDDYTASDSRHEQPFTGVYDRRAGGVGRRLDLRILLHGDVLRCRLVHWTGPGLPTLARARACRRCSSRGTARSHPSLATSRVLYRNSLARTFVFACGIVNRVTLPPRGRGLRRRTFRFRPSPCGQERGAYLCQRSNSTSLLPRRLLLQKRQRRYRCRLRAGRLGERSTALRTAP